MKFLADEQTPRAFVDRLLAWDWDILTKRLAHFSKPRWRLPG